MEQFIIEGGRPLSGTIVPSGNKNEALPALMACLLTEEPIHFRRMPRIKDVLTVCELLEALGVRVEWTDTNSLTLQADKLATATADPELCARVRASILLVGPLLARMGQANIALPGGDVIGARRIDTHVEGLEALGATMNIDRGLKASTEKLRGTELYLDEPSVTATENLILAAVMAEGKTTIFHAACEPHVVGLCRLLVSMGAKISGIGSNKLEIDGVSSLKGCEHVIGPDFMEVGSFLCLGAISSGKVTIDDINLSDLRFPLRVFSKIGIEAEAIPNQGTVNQQDPEDVWGSLVVDGTRDLKVKTDVTGRNTTIYSGPWPAFPTDLMSVAITAATQATGTLIFFEKMFESRMFFTDKLLSMGANIVLCDPHRIVINGPTPLFAAHMSSPDVRAGMSLLIASTVAHGTSRIDNIYQIERGYEAIDKKLESLGAAIKRVNV